MSDRGCVLFCSLRRNAAVLQI